MFDSIRFDSIIFFVKIFQAENQMKTKETSNRLDKQKEFENQFEQATETIENRIRQMESIDTSARLEQILHQWLLESRELYGKFPRFPSNEIGGSTILFKEMKIVEVQQFVDQVDAFTSELNDENSILAS